MPGAAQCSQHGRGTADHLILPCTTTSPLPGDTSLKQLRQSARHLHTTQERAKATKQRQHGRWGWRLLPCLMTEHLIRGNPPHIAACPNAPKRRRIDWHRGIALGRRRAQSVANLQPADVRFSLLGRSKHPCPGSACYNYTQQEYIALKLTVVGQSRTLRI